MKTPPEGFVAVPAIIGDAPTEIRDGFGLYTGQAIADIAVRCGCEILVTHDHVAAWLMVNRSVNGRLMFARYDDSRNFVVAPHTLQQDGWYAAVDRDVADELIDRDFAPEPVAPVDDTAARFAAIEPYEIEDQSAMNAGEVRGKEVFETKKTSDAIRITHVTYQCLRVTGKFENDRIEMRAEVQEGQDAIKVAGKLRELCERAIVNRNLGTRRNAS